MDFGAGKSHASRAVKAVTLGDCAGIMYDLQKEFP